jgi:hypothetical protein
MTLGNLSTFENNITVIALVKSDNISPSNRSLISHNQASDSNPYVAIGITTTTGYAQMQMYNNFIVNQVRNSTDMTDGNWHTWIGQKNSSQNIVDLIIDGTSFGSANIGGDFSAADTTTIGAIAFNSTYYDYWDGDIAEIIIYDSILSAENLTKVQNYLNQKYNI